MRQFLCTLFILFFGGLFVFGQVEKKCYPDKNALETIKFLKGEELVITEPSPGQFCLSQ